MKIVALIITYNPDILHFTDVINSLKNQVESIVVVDNGSNNISEIKRVVDNYGHTIPLSNNLGIATATNIGFKYILNDDCNYILLSDQDTVYKPTYVEKFIELEKNENTAAVYAPSIYDEISGVSKHVYQLKHGKIKKIVPNTDTYIFQTIASGLFIKKETLNAVGGMNEDLFIDMVDFEWCWRCNYLGYKIRYLKELNILHSLGDNNIKIVSKNISTRSYIRYYYLIRNCFYLSLHTEYLQRTTKISLFFKALEYYIGYSVIDKFTHQKVLNKAVIDGIQKRLGKYESK